MLNVIAGGIFVILPDWRTEAFRVARFGVVGLLSALVYAAVAAAFHQLTQQMMLATIVGQAVSTTVSYLGHLHFSFSVHPRHRIFLSRFLFVVGVAFTVNIAATGFLSSVVPYQYVILIVMVLLPAVTFLASRFWVFLPGLAEHHNLPSTDAGDPAGGDH